MDHSWGYGSERRLRDDNQDRFGVFELEHFTLLVVCDGMGGHVGGAHAAALAIRTVVEQLRMSRSDPVGEALVRAIQQANRVVYEASRRDHRLMGMGTTLVAATVGADTCTVAHVGDSRAFLVRDGQAQQLTRDHTMVNLFVDAELLTLEDAATHPEAHVLSRSLGAERQVDIELGDPIALRPDDVVVLCSDGLHGVVADWELATVGWGAPHAAVEHLLQQVVARDGDDNATAVALALGTSYEDVPVTAVPELVPLDGGSPPTTRAGVTVVPLDEVEPAPPAPRTPRSLTRTAPRVAASPVEPRPQKRRRGVWVASALAAAVVMAAVVLGAVLVIPPGGQQGEDAAVVSFGVQAPVPSPVEPVGALVGEPPTPAASMFAPRVPTAPRRLPHRARRMAPPPGGSEQFLAVDATRRKDCPAALAAVQRGMEISIDHAALYEGVWFCFDSAHQRRLAGADARDWPALQLLLHHFEGSPEDRASGTDEVRADQPAWSWPAVGGIERRLEAWSSDDGRIVESVESSFGSPTVADHVAVDVYLEALAADAMAGEHSRRVHAGEAPDPVLEQAWARRVFVLTRALEGRPGRVIDDYRPELLPELRALLEASTTARATPDGEVVEPPSAVREAHDVARGAEVLGSSAPRAVSPCPAGDARPFPVCLEPVIDLGPEVGVHGMGGRGG